MAMLLHILPCFLIMSHCYQIQEKQFTVWQGYRLNNTVIVELSVEVQNMIYCASKCVRSPHCNAASYNNLSKACELHGTIYSTIFITNDTDENQYLAIPKDIHTTTNFAETVQFETTEDKSLSTAQETALETSTINSQQKNWTILGADDCYWTNSSEYSGTISYTTGGIPCQYWNTDSPHYRYYLPVDTTAHDTNYCRETNHYEDDDCYTDSTTYHGKVTCTVTGIPCDIWTYSSKISVGHPDKDTNYCRDPDNEGAPWCYTTDPNTIPPDRPPEGRINRQIRPPERQIYRQIRPPDRQDHQTDRPTGKTPRQSHKQDHKTDTQKRPPDRHTNKTTAQTDKTIRQTASQTDSQTRPPDRQKRPPYRQTDRQTRPPDRQTYQINRQTDKNTR
ncbi:unnamed protein product [Mytilus edulis]|uniref:Uncharacterized protein n=1 Tax=Mytilus edulis TaxID=6550 RepID=A0A8S3T019_MYTED|nr:unnamed protein product [Mytilus edulis]